MTFPCTIRDCKGEIVMEYINEDLIEYIGINDNIDDYYYKGLRKIIQNRLKFSDTLDTSVYEITQVYVTCNIIDYSIVKGFNSNALDNNNGDISSNVCFIQGVLNLSIQYFDNSCNSNVSICNDSQYFSSFITLPDDIIISNEMALKAYVTDVKVNRISNCEIYYYIHTFIALNN